MKKILTILIAIIAAWLSVQPGLGAGVTLNARVGFGGYLVPGAVMPVMVEMNRTVADGRLEIIGKDQTGAFSIIHRFPVQNSKRVEASVFINETYHALKLRLISGPDLLIETKLAPELKIFPGNLVLTVQTPASAQQAIERALLPAEPVLVVPLGIADLPGTALNYDGVSGLALSDPGPVLTPIQIGALKAWLAIGGRMVLGGVRSGQNSLLAALGIDAIDRWQSFYAVGFGGITVFREEFADLKQEASQWQGLLNLKPYSDLSRLRINRIFPGFKTAPWRNPSEQSSQAVLYLAMILILWVISGLAIVVPAKRSRLVLLVCFTLLWTGAAFPVGNWLTGLWRRGAEIHSRTILLPEVGWMLTDVKVRLTRFQSGRSVNFQASPWGGRVGLGEGDYGTVKARNQLGVFTWSHGLSRSNTVVKTAAPGLVNLNGWFPNTSITKGINRRELAQLAGPNTEAVIWDGRDFYRALIFFIKNGRVKLEQPPEWLLEENEWLERLSRFSPDTVWLIGSGPLPDLVVKIEKGVFPGGLWALPLLEEVQK